jgi:hypothetical protein
MNPMRSLLLLCLLAFGCARPMDQATRPTPDAAATTESPVAAQPPPAPEGERRPQAQPWPPPSSTTPAPDSEATASAQCTQDADCGLTLVPEGSCCAMLCNPRPVSSKEAEALRKKEQECEKKQPCPVPMCAPPRRRPQAVCEAGRCAVRHVNLETR